MDLDKIDDLVDSNWDKSSKRIELQLMVSNLWVFQALWIDRFFLPSNFDGLVDYFWIKRKTNKNIFSNWEELDNKKTA